jgi:predicted alpha/beta hydrolase family esterase
MKRAVILHGTSGNPSKNWFPWLKAQLEQRGYEVWVPQLPDPDRPNRFTYEEFLKSADWDFSENLLVGHSSGATTILNLMSTDWFPHIETAVLVGTFLNEDLTKDADWYEDGQFDNLFPPDGFDVEKVRPKVDQVYFLHSDDDPYCELKPVEDLARELGATLRIEPRKQHFSAGLKEVPEVLELLEEST